MNNLLQLNSLVYGKLSCWNQICAPVFADQAVMIEKGMPKKEPGFNDQKIRSAFVRNFFFIFSMMVFIVITMIVFPHFYTEEIVNSTGAKQTIYPILDYIQAQNDLLFLSVIFSLVPFLLLDCCDGIRRHHLLNLICTGTLALAAGYSTSTMISSYAIFSILLALEITTLSCFVISNFSKNFTSLPKFTSKIFYIWMFLSSFINLCTGTFLLNSLYVVFNGLSILLFLAKFAIDIQRIMGGHKCEILPSDLFMDVEMIFWPIFNLLVAISTNFVRIPGNEIN